VSQRSDPIGVEFAEHLDIPQHLPQLLREPIDIGLAQLEPGEFGDLANLIGGERFGHENLKQEWQQVTIRRAWLLPSCV
jgi:hypothetical protein